MGRKIFISYKYADSDVKKIAGGLWDTNTVRNYVDEIEAKIDRSNHIFKAESEGEDLSYLSESTIWNQLKDRIRDSSITIVLISKNMKETFKSEKNQWIPREISYSLKEVSRINSNGASVASKSNAMLAVVIPDRSNSYGYFIAQKTCCTNGCRLLDTLSLFSILRDNMFNLKDTTSYSCDTGEIRHSGDYSYIPVVEWDKFIDDMSYYIEKSYVIQNKIDDYKIIKEVY